MSLAENALLTAHRQRLRRAAASIRFGRRARLRASDASPRFDVKAGGAEAAARSLSGGNLQKFIVGREILQQPQAAGRRAADLGRGRRRRGASSARRCSTCATRGVAVLVISEELDELFEICDRSR